MLLNKDVSAPPAASFGHPLRFARIREPRP